MLLPNLEKFKSVEIRSSFLTLETEFDKRISPQDPVIELFNHKVFKLCHRIKSKVDDYLQSQILRHHKQELLQGLRKQKFKHLHLNGRTQSVNEDSVIRSKAPGQLLMDVRERKFEAIEASLRV